MSTSTLQTGEIVATRKLGRVVEVYRPSVVIVPFVDKYGRQYVECTHGVGLAGRCEDCQWLYDKFELGL